MLMLTTDKHKASRDLSATAELLVCLPHLHNDASVRGGAGSRRNIAIPFGMEKLKWFGYPMVKKFRRYFIRFDATHERDRHTHTH